jgi:hypothetical protein
MGNSPYPTFFLKMLGRENYVLALGFMCANPPNAIDGDIYPFEKAIYKAIHDIVNTSVWILNRANSYQINEAL